MQLTGELKEKVEKAENKEEAKKILEEAGLKLTDEEMNSVAGGGVPPLERFWKGK
jgi:ABC-type transport system substrate-binding protein